jgi:hypothetical protein
VRLHHPKSQIKKEMALFEASFTASIRYTSQVLLTEREFKSHTAASSYCPISLGSFQPIYKNQQKINRKIDTLNRPDSESYLQSTLELCKVRLFKLCQFLTHYRHLRNISYGGNKTGALKL